ncbi:MAG: hypothetical protein AB7L84_09595 [Acidimicrobiia bacterium]
MFSNPSTDGFIPVRGRAAAPTAADCGTIVQSDPGTPIVATPHYTD